jgi:hypothetical protein
MRRIPEMHGSEELRVGYTTERPVEIIIQGTPRALTLIAHLIAEAISLTNKEGNTITAIHQMTGSKITVRRSDIVSKAAESGPGSGVPTVQTPVDAAVSTQTQG